MAVSLALIIIVGLVADYLFKKMKLPGLIGMLIVGVLVGPYVLSMMSPEMMQVSGDFRKIALIVILLRAGFELRRDALHRVGRAAVIMSALPAITEIAGVMLVAPKLLDITYLEAAILGSILAVGHSVTRLSSRRAINKLSGDIWSAIEKLLMQTEKFQLRAGRVTDYTHNSFMNGTYAPKFLDTEHGKDSDRESDFFLRIALIDMKTTLHGNHPFACQFSHNKTPCMTLCGGSREVWDFLVWKTKINCHLLRK